MAGRHRGDAPPSWWSVLGKACGKITRPLFAYVYLLEPWSRVTGLPPTPPLRMIDAGSRIVRPRQPGDAVTATLRIGDVTLIMHRHVVPTVVAGQALVDSWQIGESGAADRRVTT